MKIKAVYKRKTISK